MPKVYIPNRSGHNLRAASDYGEVVVMSTGTQNILSLHTQHRLFAEVLADSSPSDYLAMIGPSSLVALAAAILATKHRQVNYLVFDRGVYRERNIVYDDIQEGVQV